MFILAHAGGIDEIAFIALPVIVFLGLQWASRRRRSGDEVE